MPPTRTSTTQPAASTSYKKTSNNTRPKPKHARPARPRDESSTPAVPGVQKIKAALRQTRRLLAKEKLGADVRVETERRLRALEADLAKAEQVRKERTIAARYHKVKFFERQKITRKIAQVKRKLADTTSDEDSVQLTEQLQELRVDLNYVLHFPKAKKYISLFPPEVRNSASSSPKDNEKGKAKEESGTDAQREEVRKWIKEQMSAGELSSEPEVELANGEGVKRQVHVQNVPDEGAKVKTKPARTIKGDEFFEEEDEDDADDDEHGDDEEDEDEMDTD